MALQSIYSTFISEYSQPRKHMHDGSKALAKRYSQLKPTRAKLENQNLHRRVAKRYCQVEPAHKKPFNCLNTTA